MSLQQQSNALHSNADANTHSNGDSTPITQVNDENNNDRSNNDSVDLSLLLNMVDLNRLELKSINNNVIPSTDNNVEKDNANHNRSSSSPLNTLTHLQKKKSLFCANDPGLPASTSSTNMLPSNPPSNEIITKYVQFGVTTTTTNNNNNSSFLDGSNSNNNIDTSKLEQKKILHYNKHFGQFLGFTAFAFENEDTCNNDKIDIHVNKICKVKETSPSSLVHFFAIHHGTHGKDVSTLLKKKLRYYLFKNNNYKENPLQSISEAYQQIEHEIAQAIPKSIPCGSSSISALVIENKVYIANMGNSKCIISCKGYTPFYNVTRCNNLSVNNTVITVDPSNINNNNNEQSSSIKSSLTFEKNANAQLSPLLKQTKSITKHPNINANTNATITPQKKKQTYTTYTVPEVSEVNISNNIYFFMFVNDCIVKTLSTKALMLITYNTISHSLQTECTYEQMCSNVINQICNEVIAKGCKSTLSVLFVPVMNFVYLYNKSNTNVIRDIIAKIEHEHDNHEYIYPKCVIHDQRSVSMFSTVIHHNPQTSTFVNNDHTSKNTSPYLEKRIRENTSNIGEHYNSNMKTFETYLSVINKENNKKHCNNNKNKKKLLCGCFT